MLISISLSLCSFQGSAVKESSSKIFSGSLGAKSKASLITKQGDIIGLQVYTQQDALFHNSMSVFEAHSTEKNNNKKKF